MFTFCELPIYALFQFLFWDIVINALSCVTNIFLNLFCLDLVYGIFAIEVFKNFIDTVPDVFP